MGVLGLWQLIESAGRPVALETLEGKILAVDASILLNQAIKGMKDKQGRTIPNAHLVVLFHRVCKLLFYRVKPIFVFDGGAPELKKRTLVRRQQRREQAAAEMSKTSENVLKNLLKQRALEEVLLQQEAPPASAGPAIAAAVLAGRRAKPASVHKMAPLVRDMYELDPLPLTDTDVSGHRQPMLIAEEDSSDDDDCAKAISQFADLDGTAEIDLDSSAFLELPLEIQHEILAEVKALRKSKRKANWHELPKSSDDFSSFQVKKLIKQNKISQRILDLRKAMKSQSAGLLMDKNGGASGMSLDAGGSSSYDVEANRIMSEDNSHYILLTNVCRPAALGNSASPMPATSAVTLVPSQTSSAVCSRRAIGDSTTALTGPISWPPERPPMEETGMLATSQLSTASNAPPSVHNSSQLRSPDQPPSTMGITLAPASPSFGDEAWMRAPAYACNLPSFAVEAPPSHNRSSDGFTDPQPCGASTVKDDTHLGSIANSQPADGTAHYAVTNLQSAKDATGGISSSAVEGVASSRGSRSDQTPKSVVSCTVDYPLKAPNPRRQDAAPGRGHMVEVNNASSSEDEGCFTEVVSEASDVDLFPEDIFNVPVKNQASLETQGHVVPCSSVSGTSDNHLSNFSDGTAQQDIVTKMKCDDEVEYVNETDEWLFESSPAVGAAVEHHYSPDGFSELYPCAIPQEDVHRLELVLEMERSRLSREQKKQEVLAMTVTDQMAQEAQDLLRLFGVPFIISPSEAEAQCAALETLGHCHGCITDDSDVWLFGGRLVYKNFFKQDKFVELYKASDIENLFGLSRHKLIALALVAGSDYTDGVDGAGPVTAMEILSEFNNAGDGIESLREFSTWWRSAKERGISSEVVPKKQRLLKLQLPSGFPDERVTEAYLKPAVDDSTESFAWATPELDALREFALQRLQWQRTKTDDLVLPVIQRLNQRQCQLKIGNFFDVHPAAPSSGSAFLVEKFRSKRVKKAAKVLLLGPSQSLASPLEDVASCRGRSHNATAAKHQLQQTVSTANVRDKQPAPKKGKRDQNRKTQPDHDGFWEDGEDEMSDIALMAACDSEIPVCTNAAHNGVTISEREGKGRKGKLKKLAGHLTGAVLPSGMVGCQAVSNGTHTVGRSGSRGSSTAARSSGRLVQTRVSLSESSSSDSN